MRSTPQREGKIMTRMAPRDRYSYMPDALFRCSEGCGTFRRDRCAAHGGPLVCPLCRYIGTLTFTGRRESDKAEKGAAECSIG